MHKIVLASVFALHGGFANAQEFTSPLDVMETFYGAYLSKGVSDPGPYFSDRLTREMAGARLSPEFIASLGIDPLVGATDAQVTQLRFSPDQNRDARRAIVEVSFNNRNVPVNLTFQLIREDLHGWQIDHFEGRSGSVRWCTRTLVEAARAPSGE
jgi:hypothetical protein